MSCAKKIAVQEIHFVKNILWKNSTFCELILCVIASISLPFLWCKISITLKVWLTEIDVFSSKHDIHQVSPGTVCHHYLQQKKLALYQWKRKHHKIAGRKKKQLLIFFLSLDLLIHFGWECFSFIIQMALPVFVMFRRIQVVIYLYFFQLLTNLSSERINVLRSGSFKSNSLENTIDFVNK